MTEEKIGLEITAVDLSMVFLEEDSDNAVYFNLSYSDPGEDEDFDPKDFLTEYKEALKKHLEECKGDFGKVAVSVERLDFDQAFIEDFESGVTVLGVKFKE